MQNPQEHYYSQIKQAAALIRTKIGNKNVDTAIVLGSGLSDVAVQSRSEVTIPYTDLPGSAPTSIASHAGQLKISQVGDKTIAYCLGRVHLYEGYSAQQVAFLSYVMRELGAKKLIITNAAGGINEHYKPGDIMVIEDHINMTGLNPVLGQDDRLGQRFADMSKAYPPLLAAEAMRVGCELNLPMHLGIYVGVLGPTLETSAERRMLRILGADAVGMSTVTEVIAANHCGMQVLGLSAITNMATGNADQKADTIEEVLANAAIAAVGIEKIINTLLDS